jgi:hypothetical protein
MSGRRDWAAAAGQITNVLVDLDLYMTPVSAVPLFVSTLSGVVVFGRGKGGL